MSYHIQKIIAISKQINVNLFNTQVKKKKQICSCFQQILIHLEDSMKFYLSSVNKIIVMILSQTVSCGFM
jgi:hypothetical protein